ncbi:MAG: glycosyltransferase family 2 protein [Candidatus Limnocylindrales bacterium]
MEPSSSRPDVSVVIVHFETPDLLSACLRALAAGSGALKLEVFVIDNASRGFDQLAVDPALPGAKVVVNHRNRGFAAASNQGLREATGRYLLLLNPDTKVEPATVPTMVEYMDARPDVGCATPRLTLPDGSLDLACRRSFPTPARAFFRLTLLSRLFPRSRRFGQYNLTYLDDDKEVEIDSPCGAFMLVRGEALAEVGLLDERYFMYGEDIDWSYRIKNAGWRVMYTPAAIAHHIKRASSRQARRRTIRAFHEAMRIFYRQYYERSYPRWVSWAIYRAIDARETLELAAHRLKRAEAGS